MHVQLYIKKHLLKQKINRTDIHHRKNPPPWKIINNFGFDSPPKLPLRIGRILQFISEIKQFQAN